MLVDTGIVTDLHRTAEAAQRCEAGGYAGLWSAETSHDPFLPITLAATATNTVTLGTNIAVAFARNPMTTAVIANDLHAYSGGRFVLGLGSQIKPHIEKRFSMTWSHPAPRMREFILAMRAIWSAWNDGTDLKFRGEFYNHTLMTPFFNPGPNPHGTPKVFLAGVGTLMTEVAGETCDGFLSHGFTTEKYLRETTLPALERGRAKSGRTKDGFQISLPAFVVTGRDEAELRSAAVGTKKQIAFYGSTPAYRGVLEAHGWGELHDELNALSKRGEWDAMGERVDDEVLDAFAVVAEPDHVARALVGRFGDIVDRLTFYAPYDTAGGLFEPIVTELVNA